MEEQRKKKLERQRAYQRAYRLRKKSTLMDEECKKQLERHRAYQRAYRLRKKCLQNTVAIPSTSTGNILKSSVPLQNDFTVPSTSTGITHQNIPSTSTGIIITSSVPFQNDFAIPSTSTGITHHNANMENYFKFLWQQSQSNTKQKRKRSSTDIENVESCDNLDTNNLTKDKKLTEQQERTNARSPNYRLRKKCLQNTVAIPSTSTSNILKSSVPLQNDFTVPSTSTGITHHNANMENYSKFLRQQSQSNTKQKRKRLSTDIENVESCDNLDTNNLTKDKKLTEQQERTNARSRNYRLRKKYKIIEQSANIEFQKLFLDNSYGHACSVCDRLWFKKDLKPIPLLKITEEFKKTLVENFINENIGIFQLCRNCHSSFMNSRIPRLSRTNGFNYPPFPEHLPPLDLIAARLVAIRFPFMQIRKLRTGSKGIIGQVINIPIDIPTEVCKLPRQLEDDYTFNVNIKRHQIHKSIYLSGLVQKSTIKRWLEYLLEKPLYKLHGITIDNNFFTNTMPTCTLPINEDDEIDPEIPLVPPISEHQHQINELLLAKQHTMLWTEDYEIHWAPTMGKQPLSLLYDEHAEELAFPSIYLGEPRTFKIDRVTPYMIATSEIRRTDRRGVTPEHILFMAMRVMRFRVTDSIYATFIRTANTEHLTRKDVEDNCFIENCVEQNLSFLKCIPNSVQYWLSRKKDVFAMIRQLGKPTIFLTLTASEYSWPQLLLLLYRLKFGREWNSSIENVIDEMGADLRTTLVNEDPVVCCLYFNKLVDTIIYLLKNSRYSPFGQYHLKDYFKRIEFQQRGSPHAHILLWLENDPKETVSEDMPNTIRLIDELCCVDSTKLLISQKQYHKHTFTCYKRQKNKNDNCRFGAPFWPMRETRVLLPMPKTDPRLKSSKNKYAEMHQSLEFQDFDNLDQFLQAHNINTYDSYLNILRAGISRPRVFLKRHMKNKWINNFHPWIANKLASNTDIQFILDEYSCATYVVDYVNKSNRGMSTLHCELNKFRNDYPDKDYTELLSLIGKKSLDAVEISSQEAAWYLLNLHMSEASKKVDYIATQWPNERQRLRKSTAQMDAEKLQDDSKAIWKESCFDRYVKRPACMENVSLAQFVSHYRKCKKSNSKKKLLHDTHNDYHSSESDNENGENDSDENIDNNDDNVENNDENIDDKNKYKLRRVPKVIRYRNYDKHKETSDFKREMVLLHIPYRDEQCEFLIQHKYKNIYDEKVDFIVEARKQFESNLDIDKVLEECRQLCVEDNEGENEQDEKHLQEFLKSREIDDDFVQAVRNNPLDDDMLMKIMEKMSCIVRKRENVMPVAEYCECIRVMNEEQQNIVLELIHRLWSDKPDPLQVFLTGPAGSGKTYVLKMLMETVNRFSPHTNRVYNSYVATASTGMAATMVNGTTVHSAFKLNSRGNSKGLSVETLNSFRSAFKHIQAVIIDEISMIGSKLLNDIDERLQRIMCKSALFGGLHTILCGDLRQLGAVCQTPVYKRLPNQTFIKDSPWIKITYYPLKQVVRQSDCQFSSVLTKIGNGDTLTRDEKVFIEKRFVKNTASIIKQNAEDAIRLFYTSREVENYNYVNIQGMDVIEYVAVNVYEGYKNATQLANARANVHKLKIDETGCLPYLLRLQVGKPYMIRVNIDVRDKLVNGTIGTLRYIEWQHTADPIIDKPSRSVHRLWLSFTDSSIGKELRRKCTGHVASHSDLNKNWVPIKLHKVPITLPNKMITCHRTQFPLVAACAITIHKSQGGTYNKIVYEYSKSHEQTLVYVALSRATTIEGLFLTNAKQDYQFYHWKGKPNIELHKEFQRLEKCKQITIGERLTHFIQKSLLKPDTLSLCTFNIQSLNAHFHNVKDQFLLPKCKIMALSETWIDDENNLHIDGFSTVSRFKRKGQHGGGVAILENESYSNVLQSNKHELYKLDVANGVRQSATLQNGVGDICAANITIDGQRVILICVYITAGTSLTQVKHFLELNLWTYSPKATIFEVVRAMNLFNSPMILAGDFNIDIKSDNGKQFVEFIQETWNLQLSNNPNKSTTKNGTCIDAVFSRYIHNFKTEEFVSYFSHHRPLLSITDNVNILELNEML